VFLDFGCVQLVPESGRSAARAMHQGAAARDFARFRDGMTELGRLSPGRYRDAILDYSELCFKPIFDSPFRITRSWVAELTRLVQATKSAILGKGASFTLPPPHLALMNRLQFGFYSVLARLDVEVDYRAIEQSILADDRITGPGVIRQMLS
jgi:hypothetical protein